MSVNFKLNILVALLAVLLCGDTLAPPRPVGLPDLMTKTARAYSIHPALLRAVIEVESEWRTGATSYDGRVLKRKTWAWRIVRANGMDETDRLVWSSIGLTQIGYLVATDLGYCGEPAGLYDPATNLKYGCLRLRQCLVGHSVRGALRHYNQSTAYVDEVYGKYLEYRGAP